MTGGETLVIDAAEQTLSPLRLACKRDRSVACMQSLNADPAIAVAGNGKFEPSKSDISHRAQFHEVTAARTLL